MATRSSRAIRLARFGSTLLFALAACGGPVDDTSEDDANLSDFEPGTSAHALPFRTPAERAVAQEQADATINAAKAHLTYYGGKVVANAKVVQVLYGSGTYLAGVSGTSAPNMGTFYKGVLASAYVDWLTEYNTPSQKIGRGTFSSKVQITPASSRDKATITDANIQTELASQIAAGHLPAPDGNTIYMVNFPKGKTISQGGSKSCVGGGFCAYHGTFKKSSTEVYYGVLPDMSAGSGCDTGCGSSSVLFNNQTSVASHEMIETVTDAEVGLATTLGPPLAWYDNTNGEIGDICNAEQGTIAGSDGRTYTVQKEWSNSSGACIVHK